MSSDREVVYSKTDVDDEYDDAYMETLQSYYNASLKNDATIVGKEMGLSENEIKKGLALYSDYSSDSSVARKKSKKKNKKNRRKWSVGDHCRAMYFEDLLLYEAIIEKIVGCIATVRFIGYGNKQKIQLNHLLRSNGSEAIEEQIRAAENSVDEESADEDIYQNGNQKQNIEEKWSEGDYCVIINKEKQRYEEAVIQLISKDDNIAVVTTIGYEEPFTVSLCDLQESFGKTNRELQASVAKNGKEESTKHTNKTNKQVEHSKTSCSEKHNMPECDTSFVTKSTAPFVKKQHSSILPPPPPPQLPPPSSELLLQPDTDQEALACMLSSTYLSGYYAGYYACLQKKRQPNYLQKK